jgi:predicted dehydrogenase
MERRTFLLGSTLALRAVGANEKVNVAVVGVGGRGSYHVRRYLNLADSHVAALCDVNTAQTERNSKVVENAQGYKPKVYQDLRKLYEDKDIDAVSIATPNHWHALAAIWAMQAGKDVYGEKPASYNMFEGRQMLATARKHNRICQIGMQSRSIAHKRRAIELLHAGAIGKVYMAKGFCFKRC